jgi:hypothetical protein
MIAANLPPPKSTYVQVQPFGFSNEAQIVKCRLEEAHDEINTSVFVGGNRRTARESLMRFYNDARFSNWDGYGARPVSFETVCRAEQFLKLLPSSLAVPDVSAHPDGDVVFEWRVSAGKVLCVSLSSGSVVTYAGLFGVTERHGVENFIDEIPSEIMALFGKLFAEEKAFA